MTEKKRKSKVGAPRTEVFAMRLDPKMKYLAEIAARKQRRSLANFVEWAIEQALKSTYIDDPIDFNNQGVTVVDASSKLWHLDESDRLVGLALNYPELMTYDEQLIWRVICTYTTYDKTLKDRDGFMRKDGDDIDYDWPLVRSCWAEIKEFALNAGTKESLDAAICQHDSIPF